LYISDNVDVVIQ